MVRWLPRFPSRPTEELVTLPSTCHDRESWSGTGTGSAGINRTYNTVLWLIFVAIMISHRLVIMPIMEIACSLSINIKLHYLPDGWVEGELEVGKFDGASDSHHPEVRMDP